MTPMEMAEAFRKRDTATLDDWNKHHPGFTAEARLEFTEGRLKDACQVLIALCGHVQDLSDQLKTVQAIADDAADEITILHDRIESLEHKLAQVRT